MTQYRLLLEGFSQYAAKYPWINNHFCFWAYRVIVSKRSS